MSRSRPQSEISEVSEEQFSYISDQFKYYDVNSDGHIPTAKLRNVMWNMGHNLTDSQLQELIALVDTDGSGTIEWEEFLPLMAAKLKEIEEESFYKGLFRMLDRKKLGHIKCDDLRSIVEELARDTNVTDEEIDTMINDIDEDGNGEISFPEFLKLMTTY